MESALQLFALLVLTLLGVTTPIMAILLSLFNEGMQKLTNRYADEKSQREKVIKHQLEKIAKSEEAEGLDTEAIEQNTKELKALQNKIKSKLSYLNPRTQLWRLFISLPLSFLAVILAILNQRNVYLMLSFLFLSSISLAVAVWVLWKVLGVIIEAKKLIDDDKKDKENKTIELLSILAEKAASAEEAREGESLFLKKVHMTIDNFAVRENEQKSIVVEANKKQEFSVSVTNLEKRMAKNVEIGLIFTPDFLIEKSRNCSVYADEKTQIVRFETNWVHGDTDHRFGKLAITPLREGKYSIRTFIKAENIESTYRFFNLRVTKTAPSEVVSAD